ncbi:MAG: hypothetical protein HY674_18420 [Chloroflexi bacterium]|nr:hypothetical protein [Chloroflexota bacterium]
MLAEAARVMRCLMPGRLAGGLRLEFFLRSAGIPEGCASRIRGKEAAATFLSHLIPAQPPKIQIPMRKIELTEKV